jgi:GNAT superfamily N-acetyltransferase
MAPFEVTAAEGTDAADVAAVLARADLGSRQDAFLDLTLASEAARTFLVWDGGRPVATALALGFGASGWLANVAVAPEHRRRGLGRRVAELAVAWLVEGGARTVSLLATEMGRPIYERMGFAPDGLPYDKYRIPPGLERRGQASVRPASLETALALDREATGEHRQVLLAPFADRMVEAAGPDGSGLGYALGLPWGGGPVVSADVESAHALWWHVYGRAAGARWAVPQGNAAARDLAARYGLTPDGTSLRMRYGPALDATGPSEVWAAWSLAAG